jgi:hypothetical protein
VKFFFDNCISPNIVEALRRLEGRPHELVALRERFDADTEDPVWINALGQEGDWIIISGDPRISRGRAEKAAWLESRLTAFFCGDAWQNRRLMLQASELLGWWDDIVDFSRTATPGAGFLMEFRTKKPVQIYPVSERAERRRKKKK